GGGRRVRDEQRRRQRISRAVLAPPGRRELGQPVLTPPPGSPGWGSPPPTTTNQPRLRRKRGSTVSKSEDHDDEYEQEATVPVEDVVAAVATGTLALTSTVLTNFGVIAGSNIPDAAIIGVGGAAHGRVGAVRGVEAYLGPDPRANTD